MSLGRGFCAAPPVEGLVVTLAFSLPNIFFQPALGRTTDDPL